MKKILIIEDEPDIGEYIKGFLTAEGYDVCIADNGIEGIDLFSHASQSDPFDLAVLDIMVPGIDGYGVCEYIRKHSSIPIIFLSALSDEESVIKGYDKLADDYITKPFSTTIFLRKVRALLRRNDSKAEETEKTYTYRDITMNPDRMICTVGSRSVELTTKEYALLLLLIRKPGRVFSRSMLLDMLWDYNSLVDERIVDSHIKNLRAKLGGDYIDTVRGIGYKVVPED